MAVQSSRTQEQFEIVLANLLADVRALCPLVNVESSPFCKPGKLHIIGLRGGGVVIRIKARTATAAAREFISAYTLLYVRAAVEKNTEAKREKNDAAYSGGCVRGGSEPRAR